jgi:hypothetical protein
MIEFSQSVRRSIKERIPSFREYLQSEDANKWQADMQSKKDLFLRIFSRDHLPKLSESDLVEMITRMWAWQGWTDKKYPARLLVEKSGGIGVVRESLLELLYGDESLAGRYDSFRSKVSGLNVASISEILFTLFPERYGLWNKKAMLALESLGLGDTLPHVGTGDKYNQACDLLGLVRSELVQGGFSNATLWDVDLFLFSISQTLHDETKKPPKDIQTEKIRPLGQGTEGSIYDPRYIPPIVADFPELAKSEDEHAKTEFEKRVWTIGRILGFHVRELGHSRSGERVPDAVWIHKEAQYAVLVDGKVRRDAYQIGTDDRPIMEYVDKYSKELQREGIKRIYYLIISSAFKGDNANAIKKIENRTEVKAVALMTADLTLHLVECAIRDRHIDLALLADVFFEIKDTNSKERMDELLQIGTE